MPVSEIPAARASHAPSMLLALLCALAGCASGGNGSESFAQAGSGATVAFESIDGPPPQVFDRIVNILNTELQAPQSRDRVAREAPAAYRVRGYLAAEVSRGRTTIAWVWDVYDRDQSRALRLRGEEPGGKAGRDAWAAADDLVLRKIAQAGLSGLSSMVNGTAPPDAEPVPSQSDGPAVASADSIPQTAGVAGERARFRHAISHCVKRTTAVFYAGNRRPRIARLGYSLIHRPRRDRMVSRESGC